MVPWVGLQSVFVTLPGHTHLLHIWDTNCLWFVDDNKGFLLHDVYDFGDKGDGQKTSYKAMLNVIVDSCDRPAHQMTPCFP